MAPTTSLFTLVLSIATLALQTLAAECYRPNGKNPNIDFRNDGTGDVWAPCNNTKGEHSMCCNTYYGDWCRDNGLCWNNGASLLWRDSCTDPTWKDPACIKLCTQPGILNQAGEPFDSVESIITVCPQDNSLCCGDGAFGEKCCELGNGYFILDNGTVVAAAEMRSSSTSSSSTRTTTSTSTSTSSTSTTSSPPLPTDPNQANANSQTDTEQKEEDEDGSSSKGGLIGGVVGGVVGGLILLGLAAWFVVRKRRAGGVAGTGALAELEPQARVYEAPPVTEYKEHPATAGQYNYNQQYSPQTVNTIAGLHEAQGNTWGGNGYAYEMSAEHPPRY